MPDTPETHEIKGVEIFAAGHWNGDTYTEENLETIARTFEKTKDFLKPYLKIGHGAKQTLLAKDELPSAGFISRVYKSGQKLLADFTNVPKVIYELMKRKAYNRVSSELYVNFKANNETHPFALKAVAILGGETPAVHTLGDILNLYSVSDEVLAYREQESEVVTLLFNTDSEVITMTQEELIRKNGQLEAEVKSFKEENAALEKDVETEKAARAKAETEAKEFKAKAEALQAEVTKTKTEARDKEIDAKVKSYVEKKQITPAQGKLVTELLKKSDVEKAFSVDGKEFKTVDALIEEFVKAGEVELETEEKARHEQEQHDQNEKAFVEKVQKYAEEKKVSFKDALLALSEERESEDQ